MTRAERLAALTESWRERARRAKPEVVDTDGRLALSILATAYEACAEELDTVLKDYPR